jgi:hypothetical protein
MVSVEIDDGFEIPTLSSELVLIETTNANDRMFVREKEDIPQAKPQAAQQVELPEDDRISALQLRSSDHALPSGVYLAYVPHDQQWVMTGNIDIFLINHTGYDILYSFFLKDDMECFPESTTALSPKDQNWPSRAL